MNRTETADNWQVNMLNTKEWEGQKIIEHCTQGRLVSYAQTGTNNQWCDMI